MYFFRQNRFAYARKKLTRERRRSFNGGGETIRRGVRTEPRRATSSLEKKNITDRTIVRKGSGDKTPEEGQDLDRQENRRYRSGGDRDRGRGEGSRRGEEAGSRGRGLAVPSAGSVVAAAGHRVPVACANRGRARPTPAARLGLRLPRGHAPPPESDKRVTRSRREAAPRGQNQ